MCELGDVVGAAKCDVDPLEAARTLAEDVPWAVDQDIGDFRIVE